MVVVVVVVVVVTMTMTMTMTTTTMMMILLGSVWSAIAESLLPDCRHTLMRDRGESDRVSTLIGNLHSLTIIARQLTVSIDENYQVKVNNTNIIRYIRLTHVSLHLDHHSLK